MTELSEGKRVKVSVLMLWHAFRICESVIQTPCGLVWVQNISNNNKKNIES